MNKRTTHKSTSNGKSRTRALKQARAVKYGQPMSRTTRKTR